MASLASKILILLSLFGICTAVEPREVYDGGFNASLNDPPVLRIGNGGAGQSGLIKQLADAFIQDSVKNGSKPFRVAWVLSDNTFTIKYLQSGDADVGITYNKNAEKLAIDQGIARPDPDYHYLFRDHFLITGPPENPAGVNTSSDASTIFAQIYQGADQANSTIPVRFLTRYDKSATNIKESELWLGIGQIPWATPYSTWYHQYINFPIQALTAAITLKEYTLTDYGTYLSLESRLANQTVIYKAAADNETDPLLNPAHLLIGMNPRNETMALNFAAWAISPAGQSVITSFKKNGKQLYTGAPSCNMA